MKYKITTLDESYPLIQESCELGANRCRLTSSEQNVRSDFFSNYAPLEKREIFKGCI